MRLLFLAGSLALIASAATFACSSASPASADGKDAGPGTTSGSTNASTSSSSTSSSGSTNTGDDDDAGDLGDSGTADTGTTNTSGGLTTGGDGGAACSASAFVEQEPNDSSDTANKLVLSAMTNGVSTTSFCGNVTSADTDFVTFAMPANTRSYSLALPKIVGGNVHVSGTIGGKPFDANNGGFPNGVQAGDTWIVQIETQNKNASYDIVFNFCDQTADCNNL